MTNPPSEGREGARTARAGATSVPVAVLITLLVVAIALGVRAWMADRPARDASPADARAGAASPLAVPAGVTVALMADPQITGAPADSMNRGLLRDALAALRARPGTETPSAIVLTGRLLGMRPGQPSGTVKPSTSPSASPPAAPPASPPTSPPAAPPASPPAAPPASPPASPPAAPIAPAAPPSPSGNTGSPPVATDSLALAADSFAAVLAESPVANIYLVADSGVSPALVQRIRASDRLRAVGVEVVDLTGCYAAGSGVRADACASHLGATGYALVGMRALPALSAVPADSVAAQRTLSTAGEAAGSTAGSGGRAVLVAASAWPAPDARETTSGDTTEAARHNPRRLWEDLVRRPLLAGVLSGPAAASGAREIPYLVRAPVLGAPAGQGFTLVRLTDAGPRVGQMWYARGRFTGQDPAASPPPRTRGTIGNAAASLAGLVDDPRRLAMAGAWAIALLAAFLTAVTLWEIPDPERDVTTPVPLSPIAVQGPVVQQVGAAGAAPPTPAPAAPQQVTVVTTWFASNFGRTVISGLVGVTVVTLLDSTFWTDAGFNAKVYYIVLFVVFFLILLFSYAALRGLGEAVRSRVAAPRRPVVRQPLPVNASAWAQWRQETSYWLRRFGVWVASYRSTVVVFLDTLLNVVRGRNQMKSVIWEQTIIDLQFSLYRTIESVRENLTHALEDAIAHPPAQPDGCEKPTAGDVPAEAAGRAPPQPPVTAGDKPGEPTGTPAPSRLAPTPPAVPPQPGGPAPAPAAEESPPAKPAPNGPAQPRGKPWVRVSVSVMKGDGTELRYVATARGNLDKSFPPQSMAWISAFSGEPRWFVKRYLGEEPVLLYENATALPLVPSGALALADYFQQRVQDYGAFVVIPVPGQRKGGVGSRKGAIHISFDSCETLASVWKLDALQKGTVFDPTGETVQMVGDFHVVFDNPERLLQPDFIHSPAVAAVLRESVDVATEMLRNFNDDVFEHYIQPWRER
jgi:hypothetical protein